MHGHRVTTCFRCICDQRGIAFPTHPISTHFGSSSLIFVLLALVVIEKLTVLSAWIQVDKLACSNCSNYTLGKRGYCYLANAYFSNSALTT